MRKKYTLYFRKSQLPWMAVYIFIMLIFADFSASAQSNKITLNKGWEFHEYKGTDASLSFWRAAQVPGLIHTDLLAHHLILDPFYGDNEKKTQWVEQSEWEYRKTISVDKQLLNHRHIDLVFEGLNTLADIYLNHQLILTANNMFTEWRINIRPYLKPGDNSLNIVFHPLKPEVSRLEKKYADETGDTARSRVNPFDTKLKEATFVRKAAYEGGWDWGPRLITCGIWRKVYLQTWGAQRIADFGILQPDVTQHVAHLLSSFQIYSTVRKAGVVKLEYHINQHTSTFKYPILLHPGTNEISCPVNIAGPKLWYPRGYGAQNLYQFKASLIIDNNVVDQALTRSGLRSVRLNTDTDEHGRKFEFDLNGIPVFAKGANVIPFDHFPTRVTRAKYRQFLLAAANANMNMLRVWGGGYYESQEFYDICDELGIMVWQDFMFVMGTPPSFLHDDITKEVNYQVRRLRNHACIALWCGNNEIQTALEPAVAMIPDMFKPTLKKMNLTVPVSHYIEYMNVFNNLIPNIVKQLNPEVSYLSSSPTANFEKQSDNFNSGDRHNYEVWWNNKPIEEQATYKARFISETGIQGLPDWKTIEAFTTPGDRYLNSSIINDHQKNLFINGNAIISRIVKSEFTIPADLGTFIYFSQITQAESLRLFAENMRRQKPYSMGFLLWQLNDTWPVISWSIIDSYGRPKAAMYYARRFFAPLLVSPLEQDGGIAIYGVSDLTTDTHVILQARLMDFNGKVIINRKEGVNLKALSSNILSIITKKELMEAGRDPAKNFVYVTISKGDSVLSANSLYFEKPKDLNLPKPVIQTYITRDGNHYKLKLLSATLVPKADVSFSQEDVSLSDNDFDLLPGEPVYITLRSQATLEVLKKLLRVNYIGM